MKIDNQIVVVTGGASGMGKATADALAKLGARVAIWDRSTPAECAHLAITCDVRDAESVEAALAETKAKLGIPRIGVNCAGIAPAKRIVGKSGVMPLSAFQEVIDINLVGTFNVMRVLAEAMIDAEELNADHERGIIINTASVAAFEGQIGQAAYSASKAGVVGMTLPAAREFAQFGIRVNVIAPGLIETPLFKGLPDAAKASLAVSVPFPKRLGHPEEYAALVIHLVENTLINGEVIRLDGALRMQA